MKRTNPITKDLIAPCGMNCAICSKYLAYANNLKRSQCIGCRPRNNKCTYLFEKCPGSNSTLKGITKAIFCYECDKFPCKQINSMDKRYRNNYKMSVIENLDYINSMGIDKFIKNQYKKYSCLKCGGLFSIHNRKCFKCDTITRLVEKFDKKY
jgi:ribosomal protein L40E